jgi:hypothetical protein
MKHGDDFGQSPVGTFTLSPDEQITVVEGRSSAVIDRLSFSTNNGNIYGPYGGTGGDPFRLEGPVYGFYGGNHGVGGLKSLTCLGTWTGPSATDPGPSSPPSPPMPGMQSPAFGSLTNLSSRWDDGAVFKGHCPSHVIATYLPMSRNQQSLSKAITGTSVW